MRSRPAPPLAVAFAIVALVCILWPAENCAQVAYDSPKGRVEVLGLRRWTLQMLRDSVGRYVPGQELHDAACMVTLRDSLHFAEADVTEWRNYMVDASNRPLMVIKVVEPEQANSVQWDTRSRDTFSSLLPDYAAVVLPVTDTLGGVWRGRVLQGLQVYLSDALARSRMLASAPPSARADAERLWSFLDVRRSEAERRRSLNVLRRDGFYVNRFVAVAVLANFPAADSTWWTLARALRDPNEAVREVAGVVLRTLPARHVDWTPVTADLRLLLGGTNLSALQNVFAVLANTEVSPDLAAVLLRGNAEWLLDHLGSEAPGARDSAHRLFVRLNRGVDLGTTRVPWARWAAAL